MVPHTATYLKLFGTKNLPSVNRLERLCDSYPRCFAELNMIYHKTRNCSKCPETCFAFYLKIAPRVIFHLDMNSIRKYKSENYKDVCQIFVSAHQGITKHGISNGRKSPYIISYLTILNMIGSFYSILWSIVGLIVGLSLHASLCCIHLV